MNPDEYPEHRKLFRAQQPLTPGGVSQYDILLSFAAWFMSQGGDKDIQFVGGDRYEPEIEDLPWNNEYQMVYRYLGIDLNAFNEETARLLEAAQDQMRKEVFGG